MNAKILIISGDPKVGRDLNEELSLYGHGYRCLTANTMREGTRLARECMPDVIFLDETALYFEVDTDLATVTGLLTETAPVVVAATPGKEIKLEFLITSDAIDFVGRTVHFAVAAAMFLDRRIRLAERAGGLVRFPDLEAAGEFGEVLRHEVNNPLTGILGNTELLLARADQLPPGAIERLRTIADLAVRLRETVRRLSNAYDEQHEAPRPA